MDMGHCLRWKGLMDIAGCGGGSGPRVVRKAEEERTDKGGPMSCCSQGTSSICGR